MIRSSRNIFRSYKIIRALGRFGATFILYDLALPKPICWIFSKIGDKPRKEFADLRKGQRLSELLQSLGPSFIKMGQALSTRPDLVGNEIADDLSQLRDSLSPFPASEAIEMIEKQLQTKLENLFQSFENEPIAAASIAQVHIAKLPNDLEVAVKVLRPNIEEFFHRDTDYFLWIAEILEWLLPDIRRLGPISVVKTFRTAVEAEMDLRLEAAAASELGENFQDQDTFKVPSIDWKRTDRRVMTAERVNGIPLKDRESLIANGRNPDIVVKNLLSSFLIQAFRDGFFHADLHQGNLFVDENNNILAVDFGIMGRLDKKTRRYVAEVLLAFLAGDYHRAAEIHFEAGYVPQDKSIAAFAQACRSFGEPILEYNPKEISTGKLLAALFEVTESFEMRTQPQLLLLQKTMVVVEGICKSLAPNLDIWAIARETLGDWATQNLGLQSRAMEAAEEFAGAFRRFPNLVAQAEKAADTIAEGNYRPQTNRLNEREPGDLRQKSRNLFSHRILYGIIGTLILITIYQISS